MSDHDLVLFSLNSNRPPLKTQKVTYRRLKAINSTRNQVTANHWNLLNIQIDTSIQDLNAANTSSSGRPHFVPSILLSNAMSLAPKIDEIAYTLNSTNTDIAFFSETWLKETVPDDPRQDKTRERPQSKATRRLLFR